MGIKRFASWLEKLIDKVKKLPDGANSLMIDANGIAHNVAQKIFSYGDRYGGENTNPDMKKRISILSEKAALDTLCVAICDDILRLVKSVKPKNYLVIAFDGIAPIAKISQQRERRYGKSKGLVEEDTHKWKWNSDAITPGTEFMIMLDNKIIQWLKHFESELPKNIIYSSHLDPGEGEHKIMKYIREEKIRCEDNGPNVLYGLDADLTILSMLSPLEYIYLYKEGWDNIKKIDTLKIIPIESFKTLINNSLSIDRVPVLPKYEEVNQSCRDFAIMIQMIGNDFLSNIMSLHTPHFSFGDYLLKAYNKVRLPLTEKNGQIIWDNFKLFIHELTHDEEEMLLKIHKEELPYPYQDLQDSVTSKPILTLDYTKFRYLWYGRILEPRDKLCLDLMESYNDDPENDFFDSIKPLNSDAVYEICDNYLKGMQWIIRYYMFGHNGVTQSYIYNYDYAPLLYNLNSYLQSEDTIFPTIEETFPRAEDIIFNPIHQLLAVLPPSSRKLLPIIYRDLFDGPLMNIAPVDFEVELQGAYKKYEEFPLLPHFNPQQIIDATLTVSQGKIDSKYNRQPPIIYEIKGKMFLGYVPKTLSDVTAMKERADLGFDTGGGYDSSRGGSTRGGYDSSRGGSTRGGYDSSRGGSTRGGYDSSRGRGGSTRGGRGGYDSSRGGGRATTRKKWSERKDLFAEYS